MNNTKYTLRPIGLDITYFAYRPRVYILHWPSTPTISSESGPSASHLFIPLARDLISAQASQPSQAFVERIFQSVDFSLKAAEIA